MLTKRLIKLAPSCAMCQVTVPAPRVTFCQMTVPRVTFCQMSLARGTCLQVSSSRVVPLSPGPIRSKTTAPPGNQVSN